MNTQNINAEIITIGDEILIGQVIDTNSTWLAEQLNSLGINVYQINSVSDNKDHIISTLNKSKSTADLIIVTGGLGPTKDDITKLTIADYFNSRLVRNENVLKHVENLLGKRGVKLNELNIRQADVPENCEILHNSSGTAPGMLFMKENKMFVFLPGVPFEMKTIFTDELRPKLQSHFSTPAIVHKTLMLQGIAESMLAQKIETWENNLPSQIKLAYLPSPGLIRLRLTGRGDSEENLTSIIYKEIEKLLPYITEWYYADDNEKLEVTIGKLLTSNKKTVGTAESCTGGNIARLITSVPGSSNYFNGSVVAYANEIKENILQINPMNIKNFGAVSKEVVEEMAVNLQKKFNVDYSVATSGIAGPDGGTPEKPVGTIWIAAASSKQVISKKFSFGDTDRERNITRSSLAALNMLRKLILTENM